MAYEIEYAPSAERQVRKLPRDVQVRVLQKVDQLASHPRPSGCKRLVGRTEMWRVRIGDYRVVYRIDDDREFLIITVVGHRRDVYRDL
ncbi:MAG TPA: type II toxin-antitoxin system RelE/ParE family toxin [Tepidisphaeraceae bacterium]|nr:type II toxin-antitoxin system RelE/ParE family toxin [Tepidisphaeraceae bacterium]